MDNTENNYKKLINLIEENKTDNSLLVKLINIIRGYINLKNKK